jgi:hypothetical protein
MAKIIKKITNLKPGQDYLFTLKAKNTEISAIDYPYESIRIQTPGDQTIPGDIDNTTFFIYGNYKSVMFVFEPTVDLDVKEYEYELYSDALGTSLISTGKASASVFTIDVPTNTGAATDSSTQTDVTYYGRIRAVDTSGNSSGWTPSSGLKQSSATQLIESQHIRSLTASKITAGTINAHEIILKQQGAQTTINAPANMAIIRSSNYNGSYNNNTSTWTDGTAGWVIGGDGHAEFSSASIRGTLKAGSVFIDANNRWKTDITGNTTATSVFNVGSNDNYISWDGGSSLIVKGEIRATTGIIAGWTLGPGDLLTTGGNFLGNMLIGEIEDGVRVGMEINGPSQFTPGYNGDSVRVQYDYIQIGRESDGMNVLISPNGNIDASGRITTTNLTVYGEIDGTVANAVNADTVDGYHANDSWDDGGSIPIRGADGSIGGQYFRMGGYVGVGLYDSDDIRVRYDGYILRYYSKRDLKKDIEPINSLEAINIIKNLEPVSFKWKDNKNINPIYEQKIKSYKEYGFIAEDVASVAENLASYGPNENNTDIVPSSWNTYGMISVSVSAIKGLIKEIEDLKKRVQELE